MIKMKALTIAAAGTVLFSFAAPIAAQGPEGAWPVGAESSGDSWRIKRSERGCNLYSMNGSEMSGAGMSASASSPLDKLDAIVMIDPVLAQYASSVPIELTLSVDGKPIAVATAYIMEIAAKGTTTPLAMIYIDPNDTKSFKDQPLTVTMTVKDTVLTKTMNVDADTWANWRACTASWRNK